MFLNITPEDKDKYFKNNCKEGVIYKISNLLNGNFYIGSTKNLKKRYYTHVHDIRSNKNTCVKLIRAVNKYGEENFKFEILETCDKDLLLIREQYYLDILNPEYNISKIAGSNLGIKRTLETRLKKSISQKENWNQVNYREKHLKELSKNWKKGSSHKMAKITEADVINIKLKLKEGFKAKAISKILSLSYYSIMDIKRGKTWKHVKI